MGDLKVGRGTEPDVKVGPLIDDDQRGKVAELVDDARRQGAKVLVGGERVDGAGLLLRADRPHRRARRRRASSARRSSARSRRCAASPPRTRRSPAANDTEYGLVAYVYTQDINRAFRVIEKLDTGMIGLNQGIVCNAGRAVRRRQAVRLRARGRPRGAARVPRDEVRRAERLTQ